MKQNDLLPKEWLTRWGCRPMTEAERNLLKIENKDDFEYYVCESWLKYLLNFKTYEEIENELRYSINVDFETLVATKQKESIKKFKKPIVITNLEKGQRPDTRSTIRSGMARYETVGFQKTIKKISSRKINPICAWGNRNQAKEKIYALLSTQNDAERVFINFVACARWASDTNKNAVIWFQDLDFDMFKAQRKNFYPIVSHNIALAYCHFINLKEKEESCNATVCDSFDGIEHLSKLL